MAQVILKILASLVTEKLFREVMAGGLEILIESTDNTYDDKVIRPVIKALRGE